MQSDAVFDLAENVVATNYSDIPGEAVAVSRKCVIDTLAAMLAGTSAPGCEVVSNLAREWGGREESTVIAHGCRLPAPNAAMVNATMARAWDFDDCHEEAHDHPSVATVPTAFAMAEKIGKVSGKDLMTAITLGADLVLRLRLASWAKSAQRHSPWTTATYAPFAAAAVAGKLLGLDRGRMVNTIGLAFTEASNTNQCQQDGSLAIRVHHGMAVKAGLVAALLAERGITGPQNALEGKLGLFQAYEGGIYDRRRLLADLGRRFESANISVKPYPCCKFTHAAIDATLKIVCQHDIRPDLVEEVRVRVCRDCYSAVCEPPGRKQRPDTIVDAQFSIPYTVATAIVKRGVFLGDFTPRSISDPVILEVAARVRPAIDPDLNGAGMGPCVVEVTTGHRKTYSQRVDYVIGHPRNPMSMEQCAEKFRECAAHSIKPVQADTVEEVIRMVAHLEDVEDAGRIMRLLA
ncbi:MAG: MmgE/PrpD family protein [Chloroflexi bacterium]|nr:MmgE/PrpD family protein [Chloroflexota bacterium]